MAGFSLPFLHPVSVSPLHCVRRVWHSKLGMCAACNYMTYSCDCERKTIDGEHERDGWLSVGA